jgi:hypothetical protein
MAGLSDTPDCQGPEDASHEGASGSADAGSLAGVFAEKIGELARQYEDGHEPDFATASLSELFAWSLARRVKIRGS